ncbi:hypothetical protein [Streptomyces sp. AN091965]|uniref:hypothetical protein n=1 Tax=Streptomyces sp. AN091965 TaxID=2927803 RepID=UPI001F61CF82|nr:hypothetical protein [Streptomyces sp. AN091965]MCI3928150.1 hypothetical protein [Streptomyces sp. AN091965]
MEAPHRCETHRLQENIDRRAADQQMVLLLAQDGFAGRRYERFEEELARYGISVLRAWMHSGFLFQLLAAHGFDLHPDEREIEELARDSEVREELATMTVARALPRFRRRALVEGGWSHEGGASIATYFMGACAYEFPNEYRRHRSHQERWRRAVRQAGATAERPTVNNVASEVLGKLRVLDDLTDIGDPRMRTAVALTLDDYTQEEIKEILGASSVRAIEGLLYRWRTAAKREEGERHG